MKLNYILIIGFTALTISCGKSEKQIEKEQAQLKLEKKELAEKKEKEKIHLEKIEVGKSKLKLNLNNKITQLKRVLQEEQNNLNEINEFKWGRSSSTKEEQIKQQNLKINQIKNYISGLENELIQANIHKSFEFQEDPISLVNYIINSAKNRDFSRLRHLCDPYGENDSDVNGICLIESQPTQVKNNFARNFKNARIMGEPKIQNINAEVEIALGENSNKLEKINLVKRMNKWYIISL